MIELKDGGPTHISMNDMLMGLSSMLQLNWKFGRQPGGEIISAQGNMSRIPFIAKKALIKKSDIQKAFVKSSDDIIKATSQIHVIRDCSVVRIFPVAYSGERQLNPPHITAGVYSNPAAGNPGFARQAGSYLEFVAAYTDSNGKTQAGAVVKVRTDRNSTISQQHNHVFLASSSILPDVNPANPSVVDQQWASKGVLNTGADFPAFMVVPYDQVSGKETAAINIPANPTAALNGLVADYSLNHKPVMYATGTSTAWSASCEVCFGVIAPDGVSVVRTSDVVTITSAASKQFYPDSSGKSGNGWDMSADQQLPILRGVDQLLKHPLYPKTYLKVKAMLLWRPAGQTKWSKATSFTANTAPVASYFHIPAQSTYAGEYNEMTTLPQVTKVTGLLVGLSVNSEPLGVVGDGPAAAKVFRVSTDANTYLLNPFPQVVSGYVSYERNAKMDAGSKYSKYELGNVPVIDGHQPCGVVLFGKNPNLTDDMKHPRLSPTGDKFFIEGERVRVDLSVHTRADATGAEWYVRNVTRAVSGSESRGSWGKMTGSGFSNQYLTNVTANANPPIVNTTLVRPGNNDGYIDWNNPLADEFVLLPGDQITLTDFVYTPGSGRQGYYTSGFANPMCYNSFDIGIPVTLLE